MALARGGKADCFGPAYDQGGVNPALHFTAEPMLMLDRVVSVDPSGGAWGLGMVVAEKDLAPDHWYFPCHFKDDHVLAGSLMADGCGQLMRFYMMFLGLQTRTRNAHFQPLFDLPQQVRCRGQVIPGHSLLTYRMEVKEIGTDPRPYAIADVDILLGDKIVVDFKDLGVAMVEQDGGVSEPRKAVSKGRTAQADADDRDEGALFTKFHLEEFATGSIAKCFGPDFSMYEDRQPPRTPNGDLQLISRVLETKGRRLDFKKPSSVVAEYDVPEDAWFFRQNSHPGVMPYSILMEISLQPNGFVSAWMGTTLTAPDVDFCFRNLDGQGTILRPIDLRGKTITNRSELLSTVTTGNTIIQQFRWDLSHGGEPFYEGTAVFGYFLHSALTNQIGLDGGVANDPLQTREYLSDVPVVHIDLKSAAARKQLYAGEDGQAARASRRASTGLPRRSAHRGAGRKIRIGVRVRVQEDRSVGLVLSLSFPSGPGDARFPGGRVDPAGHADLLASSGTGRFLPVPAILPAVESSDPVEVPGTAHPHGRSNGHRGSHQER